MAREKSVLSQLGRVRWDLWLENSIIKFLQWESGSIFDSILNRLSIIEDNYYSLKDTLNNLENEYNNFTIDTSTKLQNIEFITNQLITNDTLEIVTDDNDNILLI